MKNNKHNTNKSKLISRKEAINRTGKYAAVTALGMFAVLSPRSAQAGSQTPQPPSW